MEGKKKRIENGATASDAIVYTRTRISLLPNILSNAFLKDVMAFPILTRRWPRRAAHSTKRERETSVSPSLPHTPRPFCAFSTLDDLGRRFFLSFFWLFVCAFFFVEGNLSLVSLCVCVCVYVTRAMSKARSSLCYLPWHALGRKEEYKTRLSRSGAAATIRGRGGVCGRLEIHRLSSFAKKQKENKTGGNFLFLPLPKITRSPRDQREKRAWVGGVRFLLPALLSEANNERFLCSAVTHAPATPQPAAHRVIGVQECACREETRTRPAHHPPRAFAVV